MTVLAAGSTAGGHPFLVMPFHPADSLDRWIREHGPITVRDALSIGVKISGALATSREPLNIAGESVVLVAPLTARTGDEEHPLHRMARFDAVALFCERT